MNSRTATAVHETVAALPRSAATVRRTAAALLTVLLCVLAAAPAQATGYRYWSFWDRTGDRWVYATQGPSTARPTDGDVQGFRFAVSEDSADASQPRGTASFAAICAKTPAREGRKRVALVLDFGTPQDAPSGETPPAARVACAQVSPGATTAEALAAVAKPLRYDTNALLCAISGYPEHGCGEQVSSAGTSSPGTAVAAPQQEQKDDDGPSLGLYAGGTAVAALAAAVFWQSRRRRDA